LIAYQLIINSTQLKKMKKGIGSFRNDGIYVMRLFSLAILLAVFTPVIANAQSGAVNFAGTWALNAEKSNLGDNPGSQRMWGGNFVVTQEANLLTVVRTRTNQNGESVTTTMKYTLDGKESVNASPRGDSKSVAKWSADGKTLAIETSRTFDMNGQSITMKSSEVWSLTDAKTISVAYTFQGRDGEVKATVVCDKK
jgi:dipeptidyl aminopeptidase/acylaminoacyl peptidase